MTALNLQITVFADRHTQMQAAATYLATTLAECQRANGGASAALAGGNTPKEAYQLLAAQPLAWQNIQLMPTDERCVALDDPRSNHAMLKKTLGADKNIVLLQEGDTPNTPDVVLLGAGSDGHIASLFPDTINIADPIRVSKVQPQSQAEQRLTLPLSLFVAVEKLLLLICGADKFHLLGQTEETLPLVQLLQQRAQTTIYYSP